MDPNDLTDVYFESILPETFVGPVQVTNNGRMRSLVVTQDVTAGQLLFVVPPLVDASVAEVRRICLDANTDRNIHQAAEDVLRDLALSFQVDTVLSYCHYNLLIDDLSTVLAPLAQSQGIGLINASPLHMGILSTGGEQDWHPAPQAVRETGRKIADLCQQRNTNVVDVALRYALDYEGVASTLCGMRTAQEVDQNLALLESQSDQDLLNEIAALVAPVKNRTWHEGLPENAPPPPPPPPPQPVGKQRPFEAHHPCLALGSSSCSVHVHSPPAPGPGSTPNRGTRPAKK